MQSSQNVNLFFDIYDIKNGINIELKFNAMRND